MASTNNTKTWSFGLDGVWSVYLRDGNVFEHPKVSYEDFYTELKKLKPMERPTEIAFSKIASAVEVPNHSLECIDLCNESLKKIYIQSNNTTDTQTLGETWLHRACGHHHNNVEHLCLNPIHIPYSTFVAILAAQHCCIKALSMHFNPAHPGTWTPKSFRNLDYSKLKRLVFRTSCGDQSSKHALLDALKESPPSQLEHLGLDVLVKIDFEKFTETIQQLKCLRYLGFAIAAVPVSDVLALLGRLLSPGHSEVATLSVSIAGVCSMDFFCQEDWLHQFIPILQRNVTLCSFPQVVAYSSNRIMKRNSILAKLKTFQTRKKQERGPNIVLPARILSSQNDVQVPALAKTISKMASITVEASALYYFLQQNVGRITGIQQCSNTDSLKRPQAPKKQAKS